jgi:tetratricopeptide (TPR) repeat protein
LPSFCASRDPLDPHNHGFLGDALRREGKPLEAAEAFRAALWLHPGYAWAARQLAGLLYERGDPAGARSVLCAALEADPDESEEPWLLACLGIAEARLGRKRRAEQCFHRSLERARMLPPEPGMPAALDGLLGLILEA